MKLFFVLAMVTAVVCSVEGLEDKHSEDKLMVYCGRRLVQALSIICQKFDSMDANSIDVDATPEERKGSPRQVRSTSIYEKCCYRGCLVSELIEYCG